MPTVHGFNGLRVVIYPNDHRPAHVHVVGPDAEAVFVLHCPDGPVQLRDTFGFSRNGLNRIRDELDRLLAHLCAEWRAIHDHY